MDFFVGTFNKNLLYTLTFSPPSDLRIVQTSQAVGPHSWLALSPDKRHLYTSVWVEPPTVAAYRIPSDPHEPLQLLNTAPVSARSGYVACTRTHLYTVGGPSGEVFRLNADGSIGALVQRLAFEDGSASTTSGDGEPLHGDFGGVRHGAHSVDLAPDGRSLYVADIGRNCVWTFSLTGRDEPHAQLGQKAVAPRANDGPRHATPHPNGRMLYSLQEHSSMVDAFGVAADGTSLTHVRGVKIIPADKRAEAYWADEVRLSKVVGDAAPRYLYASTRGLEDATKGYVAVFALGRGGEILGDAALDIYETPTSGGFANAVEPAPPHGLISGGTDGVEYVALTDSLEGWVFVLSFDGIALREAARIKLEDGVEGGRVGAATAVWL